MRYFLTITILLFSLDSHADDKDDTKQERSVVYKQRTEIDFEGVEVQGELVKPQGSLLLERRNAHFNPLIKLRTDFDDEMSRSVDEIK
jgi:hypothetical protein